MRALRSPTPCMSNEAAGVYHDQTTINSLPQACAEVIDEFLAIISAFDYNERDQFAIRLSSECALTNALQHGNRFDPNCTISVAYTVSDRGVHITVTDEGAGFDPNTLPDPTAAEKLSAPKGRGLALMRHFMDGVRFNKRGNTIEIWKRRSVSSRIAKRQMATNREWFIDSKSEPQPFGLWRGSIYEASQSCIAG